MTSEVGSEDSPRIKRYRINADQTLSIGLSMTFPDGNGPAKLTYLLADSGYSITLTAVRSQNGRIAE